jgi:hypothetical protein
MNIVKSPQKWFQTLNAGSAQPKGDKQECSV